MRAQVINNSQGEIYAQMQPLGRGIDGKQIEGGDIVVIKPGLNFIDAKKLAELRKNQAFEVLFKTKIQPSKAPEANPQSFGKLILVEAKDKVADESPLAGKTDPECKAMIEEVQNTDLLSEWLKESLSNQVRRDIHARIAVLAGGIVPDPVA